MSASLDAALRTFLATAYAAAPGVTQWFDQAGIAPGDVQSVADLDKIPVLTKDRMVELQAAEPPFGGFLGVPMARVKRVFLSPGPLLEPHGDETVWQEAGADVLRAAGFGPDDVVLNALGYHLSPGGFLLDGVLQAVGATVVPVGVGNAELQLKMMMDLQAAGYAGTPSWLMSLLQKAEEAGIDRGRIPLRRALLSAEPLPPTMRATLADDYGLTVLNAYATGELGVLAYDLTGAPVMQLVDTPIIQIVDRDTGKTVGPGDVGEIVVTNLNPTYPLIRFGTGDLAMNLDPAPGESRQGERSIRLVGRVGDAVKVRGMFVHPNQVRAVMAQVGIDQFCTTVTRPDVRDELAVDIVLPGVADEADVRARLEQAFRDVCRVGIDQLQVVDAVPTDAPVIDDQRTWD